MKTHSSHNLLTHKGNLFLTMVTSVQAFCIFLAGDDLGCQRMYINKTFAYSMYCSIKYVN